MEKAKVTNGEVLDLFNGIEAVNTHAVELPFKMFYAMSRTRSSIVGDIKAINDTIEKLRKDLRKHIIKNATGEEARDVQGKIKYEAGTLATFNEKQNELLAVETEIEVHIIQYAEFEKEVPKLKGFPGLHAILSIMVTGGPGETPVKKLGKADAQ